MDFFTLKGQFENLTSGQGRSTSNACMNFWRLADVKQTFGYVRGDLLPRAQTHCPSVRATGDLQLIRMGSFQIGRDTDAAATAKQVFANSGHSITTNDVLFRKSGNIS